MMCKVNMSNRFIGSLYVRNPDPKNWETDRWFRIFYYEYNGGHLYSSEHRRFVSHFPKKLIAGILNMLTTEFSAVELSNGSCQINVISSELFNRQHAHIVEVMLQRTIFRISLVEAQDILKKLRFEGNVWKLEECGEYCLVVLSPSRWTSASLIEPDFAPEQTWTQFRNAVIDLTARKSATATATEASTATTTAVQESGK